MKTSPIKYGVIAGLCAVAYLLIIYLYAQMQLEKQLMVHPYVTMSRHIFYLLFMGAFIHYYLKNAQQVLPLKDMIRPLFVIFLIANGLFYVFYFVMFKYIDPSLLEASNSYMLDFLPEVEIEGVPGKIKPGTADDNVEIGLSATFFAYVREIILGFIFSLVIALFRRNG